jgi:putative polyketide hydroxylase
MALLDITVVNIAIPTIIQRVDAGCRTQALRLVKGDHRMSNDRERSTPAHDEGTPVLIVGGGLVGLSTAVFLAYHDVPCLLVERHPDLLIHPRARGFTPRTVELYRQVGLEAEILAAGYAGSEQFEWVAVRAETLASEEYTPAEEQDGDDGFGDASPSPFAPIDQDKLEILLRAKAEELGAIVRFSTELTSFEQDGVGITAGLKDRRTGAERTVRANYLVAADGWDSPVRRRLGIGTDGPGPFFHTITAMIDADLTAALRGRRLSIAYLQRPRPGTILMAHDEVGYRWVFGTGFAPERGESVEDYTDERCIGLVREAAGLPGVEMTLRPQIPGTDLKVLGFTIGAQVAQRYREGGVFLVGDAAHIVPPTGGLGANTGIQDAHNLAWKLAAVLQGQAGPSLLDTYHAERRPVGLFTMQQALARWRSRVGTGGVGGEPLVDYAAVAFGYRYRSPAVLGAPEDPSPALHPGELKGQPGTRAPHVTVALEGREISTIDLYGRRFVLLAGAGATASWVRAAERVAQRLDVPLEAYRFGVEVASDAGAAAHGIGADGALLVRPDGFVAWRAETAPENPERELERALSRLLCHTTSALA